MLRKIFKRINRDIQKHERERTELLACIINDLKKLNRIQADTYKLMQVNLNLLEILGE